MAENRYTWELGLSASDLTKALQEVMGAVKSIDKALNDMGEATSKSLNEFKKAAKPAISEIEKLGTEIGKVFNSVEKDLGNAVKAINQADMSKWEKAAYNYGEKVKKAQSEVDALAKKLESVTANDEERLVIQKQIADTQAKINALTSEQQKSQGLAQIAEQAKNVKQFATDVDRLFKAVSGNADALEQSLRQIDMTPLEKQADNYSQAIAKAVDDFTQLEQRLNTLNASSADRLNLEKQIQATEEKIFKLMEAQEKASNLASESKKNAEELKKAAEAAQELAAHEKEIRATSSDIDKLFNSISTEVDGVSKNIKQMNMTPLEKQADNYSRSIEKANAQLEEMRQRSSAIANTEQEREQLEKQLAATQQKINSLVQEQQRFLAAAANEQEKMSASQSLKLQADSVKQAYSEVRGAVQEVAMTIGIATAAIIAGISSAGKEFSEFEGKLVAFKAISKASAEEMGQFKQLARDMSEFGKTSTEVANLGVEFAKAGLSAEEVAKAMKSVTVASVATQEDLLTMGTTVDSVRSQFGLSADEFDRVSNGLVLAANESKIGIQDLAESYKYVGSTARQTGQPLETINALLVILGNNGIKASQAGNGLQNTLLKLTDPGVRKALTNIGVDAVDAQGNVRKLTDIVIELQKGLGNMGKADQAAFLKDQFGEVAVNPLLALMAQTQDKIRETEATMLNWNGVQDRIAKDMQKGLLYAFKQMKASVQVAQQVFIENMAPALEALTRFVKGAADAFTGLPKPLQFLVSNGALFVGGVGLIATAIAGIAIAANTSIMALGSLGNALVAFTTGAPAVAGGITGINAALTGVSAGFKALPAAAATASAGYGKAITGFLTASVSFIALASSLYLAWEYNLGGFQDIFKEAADSVMGLLNDLGLGIVDWQTLWNNIWITIQDTTFAVVAIIDQVLRGLFEAISITFRVISDVMVGNWSGVWETITGMSTSAANWLMKSFGKFFTNFGKLFQTAIRGLSEVWAGFMDNITNPTNPNAGADRIKAGMETIGSAVSRMGTLIGDAWSGAFDSVYKGAADLANKGREILKIDELQDKLSKKRKTDAAAPSVAPTETYGGKNAGKDAKKAQEDAIKAEIDRVRQSAEEWELAELKKAESTDNTTASVDALQKKIGESASAFASDRQGAIEFQKRMQGIGATCAATTSKILEMSGVTQDMQKILGNENWVPNYDKLIAAGYAQKVALKDIKAGDLVLGYSKDPNSNRGHIGVAVDNKRVVHASSAAGRGAGVRQLAAVDSVQSAFSASLNAGDDVHGLRFTEQAFKPEALNNKDIKEKQIKIDALKQQYEALIALQAKLQAAGQKSEALDKRIDELRIATGKSQLDLIKAQKKAHEDAQKEIQKAIGETIKAISADYKKLEDTIKSTLQNVAKSNQDMVDEFEDAQLTAAEKSAKYAKREIEAIDQTLSDSYMGMLELAQQIKDLQSASGNNPSTEQQAEINDLLTKRTAIEKALLKIQADRDDRQDLLTQKTRNAITEEIKGITASGDSLKEFLNKLETSNDYLERFTGGLGLTEEQANMLSEALAKIDFDEATKGAADKLENRLANINKEQEKFSALINGAADAAAGLASAFGETGRNIAAGIKFVGQMSDSISRLVSRTNAEMVKSGGDTVSAFQKILENPENIRDVVGLITAGVGVLTDSISSVVNYFDEVKRLSKENANANANAEYEASINAQKRIIEAKKLAGESTLENEKELIKQELKYRLEKSQQQLEEINSRKGSGIFGSNTIDDLIQRNKDLLAVYKEQATAKDEAKKKEQEAFDAETARIKNRTQQSSEITQQIIEARAALTSSKIDDALADNNKNVSDILDRYNEQIAKAKESGNKDLSKIEELKRVELERNTKEFNKRIQEINSEALKAEKEAYFNHQEAILNLQADTFDRGIELQRLALNKEIAMLDIEISNAEAGSVERQRLETQKVDTILAANAAIQQSIEQSKKDREKELRSLALGIAQLKAQIKGDAGELLAAGTRQTFADLYDQEASQIEEARKKYQNAEEVITQIRAMYALKREAESKKMLEEGIKTYRDKYAAEQEKALKSQQAPLQAIIDKETARIKEIDKQNAAYEYQNKLIDDRFAKEQALFDQQDKSLFTQGLGGVDLASGLTAGANYLANEDIINGTITDRTSRETQLRGLSELLDMQAQEADSKLKLEDISQEQYAQEMTRITLMRARLIQEQMLDAQNEKDKADLNKQFAEQYVAYQKLQKDAIDARRSAERRTNDELISSNNRLKEESQASIDFNKAKIDDLQANYDLRLKQIDEQIAGVSATSTGWIESLKAIAPTLAEQATAAIASIKAIREEFSKPVSVSVASSGSSGAMTAGGSLMSSGGYTQSNTIESRDRQMVDSYGSFSVQGNNGRWYLSTSQMQLAEQAAGMIGGLRAFAEGGVIPDYAHYQNDGAIIKASAGERVLQSQFNRRMENMLQFFELPRGFGAMGGGVNINIGNISNDVDLKKLEAVFDKHLRGRETLGVKRWGINSLSRN